MNIHHDSSWTYMDIFEHIRTYMDTYIYIYIYKHIWTHTSPERLVEAACGASATSEKWLPWIVEHVYCHFCRFSWILASPPWICFSKSGQSVHVTMPARRASKFSAKWRAIKLQTIFQSLNSQAIPGFCEPWSECQPEQSRPPEGWPKGSSIFIYNHCLSWGRYLSAQNA